MTPVITAGLAIPHRLILEFIIFTEVITMKKLWKKKKFSATRHISELYPYNFLATFLIQKSFYKSFCNSVTLICDFFAPTNFIECKWLILPILLVYTICDDFFQTVCNRKFKTIKNYSVFTLIVIHFLEYIQCFRSILAKKMLMSSNL